MELDAMKWSEQVFGGCELGDRRRTERLAKVGASLAKHGGGSVHRAAEGDAAANQGAYRWLDNAKVDVRAVEEGGYLATAAEAAAHELLVAVEDTTSLSYTHALAKQLGDLGGPVDSDARGLFAHTALLLNAHSGQTVGVIEQERWIRPMDERGKRHQRKSRAYEEKESFKWQRADERIARRLGPLQERVIAVCDREADVYEYLHHKCSRGERFVVRASWDRGLKGEPRRLRKALEAAPVLGAMVVTVEQRGGPFARRKRLARVEVRAAGVKLRAPAGRRALGALAVNAVLVRELEPPEGEEPLDWMLLTSEPVEHFEQVLTVVHYYRLRWRTEDYHKAWKSGVGVERSRLQSLDNLQRMAVVLSFVAVRLLQLREALGGALLAPSVQAAEATASRPCSTLLQEHEWQLLWATVEQCAPPAEPPSLRWAYEHIAKLGGWLDTKGTGRVGWDTLWRGWFRLQERIEAYRITKAFL